MSFKVGDRVYIDSKLEYIQRTYGNIPGEIVAVKEKLYEVHLLSFGERRLGVSSFYFQPFSIKLIKPKLFHYSI